MKDLWTRLEIWYHNKGISINQFFANNSTEHGRELMEYDFIERMLVSEPALLEMVAKWKQRAIWGNEAAEDYKLEISNMLVDLKWALETSMELNMKIGHRGSNEEDRLNDEQYNKAWELLQKYKLDK